MRPKPPLLIDAALLISNLVRAYRSDGQAGFVRNLSAAMAGAALALGVVRAFCEVRPRHRIVEGGAGR